MTSVSPRRRRRRRRGPSSGWQAEGSRCSEWPWLVGRGCPLRPLVAGSSHLGVLLFFCSGNTINLLKNNPDWCHSPCRGRASPPAHPQCWLVPQAARPLRRHPHPPAPSATRGAFGRLLRLWAQVPATQRCPPSLVLATGFLGLLCGCFSIFTPGKFSLFHLFQ